MTETKKLYYDDVACLQFCATVMECTGQGRYFSVVLDRTAFFPEGGGQPADHGALGGARVLDVQEKDGVIMHTVTVPLTPGQLVQGDVDGMRRMDHMQQHSGEHIVSGIVHARYGYDNVGFHIGEKDVTVDFSGPLSTQQLAEIEKAANWFVLANQPVTEEWPSPEELARIPYRSKKKLTGAVRIVHLGNADVCACCGTHVRYTGDIGMIKLTGAQSYKGGTRVTLLCGMRAFEDYCAKLRSAQEISGMLSAKIDVLPDAVRRLAAENEALKAQRAALENRLFAMRAEENRGRKNPLVFEEGLSPDSLRRMCTAVANVCSGICGAFSGSDETGYKYVLCGSGDVPAAGRALNKALSGRGGGRDLWQGSAECTRSQIEDFFCAM